MKIIYHALFCIILTINSIYCQYNCDFTKKVYDFSIIYDSKLAQLDSINTVIFNNDSCNKKNTIVQKQADVLFEIYSISGNTIYYQFTQNEKVETGMIGYRDLKDEKTYFYIPKAERSPPLIDVRVAKEDEKRRKKRKKDGLSSELWWIRL